MTSAGEEQAGQILSQDVRGRVLVTRERRESLLEEYDRSGMSGVRFAKYVGIKYTTLAYWLKRRRCHREREKLMVKAEVGTKSGLSSGTWIEAVVDQNGAPAGALRIYFAGGAYCQINSTAEVALAAELLRGLGARR